VGTGASRPARPDGSAGRPGSPPAACALIAAMKSRFNRVALVSRPQTESVGGTVREIAAFLRARGVSVLVEERSAVLLGASELETASLERIGHEADLAIAI